MVNPLAIQRQEKVEKTGSAEPQLGVPHSALPRKNPRQNSTPPQIEKIKCLSPFGWGRRSIIVDLSTFSFLKPPKPARSFMGSARDILGKRAVPTANNSRLKSYKMMTMI